MVEVVEVEVWWCDVVAVWHSLMAVTWWCRKWLGVGGGRWITRQKRAKLIKISE
jgi:hypothetical protein